MARKAKPEPEPKNEKFTITYRVQAMISLEVEAEDEEEARELATEAIKEGIFKGEFAYDDGNISFTGITNDSMWDSIYTDEDDD